MAQGATKETEDFMKHTLTVTREIPVSSIRIQLNVRYGDEDIPYDFPLRNGDTWEATVDVDTGKIRHWPAGKTGSMYMKVCDEGSYYLMDSQGAVIASRENDYVPHGVVPGEYGDYVELEIAEDGTITNWPKNTEFSAFENRD